MIDLSTNCLFIHIPKTAGQSIESVFLKKSGLSWNERDNFLLKKNNEPKKGPPRLAHLTAMEYTELGYLTQQDFYKLFKFSFVRDPFQRLVSEYLYQYRTIDFKKFVLDVIPKTTTDNYIEHKGVNRHIMPQWMFLYDGKGDLLVDFVGKFENLQTDFNIICDKIGFTGLKLPYRNKTKIKKRLKVPQQEYLSYYDNETYDFIRKYYKKDINLFNYEQESRI